MKLNKVESQIRSYFAERTKANEERSRRRRVANHSHNPECTLTGDIVFSTRKDDMNHTIEVFECFECHSVEESDRTQRFSDAVGTFGLWY